MDLFDEISAILAVDLQAFLPQAEQAGGKLRATIRHTEETLVEAQEQAAQALAHERFLFDELSRNRRQIECWQSRWSMASGAGDLRLAELAAQRRDEHERIVAALKDHLHLAHDVSQSLMRQLDALRTRLTQGRRLLAAVQARQETATAAVAISFPKEDHTAPRGEP